MGDDTVATNPTEDVSPEICSSKNPAKGEIKEEAAASHPGGRLSETADAVAADEEATEPLTAAVAASPPRTAPSVIANTPDKGAAAAAEATVAESPAPRAAAADN